MANTIQHKRYALEANIPSTGLNPGELIMAVDTGNLYYCWTANAKVLIGKAADFANYLAKAQNLNDLPDKAQARTNLDVFSKGEVQNLLSGLNWKPDVKVLSTTNVNLTGTQTIDGIPLVAGDRVAVVGQANATQNGIYVVAAGAWSRSTDSDSTAELQGMTFGVAQGNTQADTIWRVFTDSVTIGTTNIDIQPFTGVKNMVAGFGIKITGNTIDIDLEELTEQTTIAAGDYVIIIDVDQAGTARQRKMTRSNFLSGIVSDTYKVKTDGTDVEGYLDDKIDVVANKGLKKTKAGGKVMMELEINNIATMGAGTVDAAADFVPLHDASGNAIGKATVNEFIKNASLDGGSF